MPDGFSILETLETTRRVFRADDGRQKVVDMPDE